MGGTRPPFASWRMHFFNPAFGFAWYMAPDTLVTQSTPAAADLAAAKVMTSLGDRIVKHDLEAVRAAGGLRIVHDWRSFRSYKADAREWLFQAMRSWPKGAVREMHVAIPDTPLWHMAVSAGNLLYALAGIPAPITAANIDVLLRRTRLRPPVHPAPAWFTSGE